MEAWNKIKFSDYDIQSMIKAVRKLIIEMVLLKKL